jgi:hypothetical protein
MPVSAIKRQKSGWDLRRKSDYGGLSPSQNNETIVWGTKFELRVRLISELHDSLSTGYT